MTETKFYTPRDVSELLAVSTVTVWRWINRGKLRAARLGGHKSYRIGEEDLQAFIDKHILEIDEAVD